MALEIILKKKESDMPGCKSDRRLWLTRDKSKVVEDGDPSAGWLFARIGGSISVRDMEVYNLTVVDDKVVLPGSEEKSASKSEDKSRPKAEDKSHTKAKKKLGTQPDDTTDS